MKGKTSTILQLNDSLMARNSLINLLGQSAPLIIGVFATPLITQGLGSERFGLLSMVWVVLGYFNIFDMGMGRAATKYVAEAIGEGRSKDLSTIVWTAVVVQTIFGIIGALILAGSTSFLVERILAISPELVNEAKRTFYALSFSIPIVLVAGSFSGVLEAMQRFDLINAVNASFNASSFLLPLFALILGFSLPGIVVLLLIARITALVAFVAMGLRLLPSLKEYSFSVPLLPDLFAFGGWVTLGNRVLNPLIMSLDRWFIGSFLSMSAVAYYSLPYEGSTKLGVISASLTATLFPAFSTLVGMQEEKRIGTLFARSVKYILLVLGPLSLIISLFAQDILRIWLGVEYADKGAIALQILAISALITSLSRIHSTLLTSTGHPEIPTKFRLLELPAYAVIIWFCVKHWGITGAAIAWTLRVALDGLLLFTATIKIYPSIPHLLWINRTGLALLLYTILCGIVYLSKMVFDGFPLLFQVLFYGSLLVLYVWYEWIAILDDTDHELLASLLSSSKKGIRRIAGQIGGRNGI